MFIVFAAQLLGDSLKILRWNINWILVSVPYVSCETIKMLKNISL